MLPPTYASSISHALYLITIHKKMIASLYIMLCATHCSQPFIFTCSFKIHNCPRRQVRAPSPSPGEAAEVQSGCEARLKH